MSDRPASLAGAIGKHYAGYRQARQTAKDQTGLALNRDLAELADKVDADPALLDILDDRRRNEVQRYRAWRNHQRTTQKGTDA